MSTIDPVTVAVVGLLAIVLAAISYLLGCRYTDRKTASLRRRVFDADARYLHLAGELGKLTALVDSYAQDCDADSDDIADIAARIRRLEERANPSPRQRFEDGKPRLALTAMPAAPSVRDAIDPAWNGGTSVFDELAAKFPAVTDVPLWEPPTERAVLTFPLASNDDTATIPVVTGELVAQ